MKKESDDKFWKAYLTEICQYLNSYNLKAEIDTDIIHINVIVVNDIIKLTVSPFGDHIQIRGSVDSVINDNPDFLKIAVSNKKYIQYNYLIDVVKAILKFLKKNPVYASEKLSDLKNKIGI